VKKEDEDRTALTLMKRSDSTEIADWANDRPRQRDWPWGRLALGHSASAEHVCGRDFPTHHRPNPQPWEEDHHQAVSCLRRTGSPVSAGARRDKMVSCDATELCVTSAAPAALALKARHGVRAHRQQPERVLSLDL
jgi:hypothetical protein